MMKKVFLSYSSRDQAFARQLRDRLSTLGVIVSEPATSLRAGEAWVAAIQKDIEGADAILAVIPENGQGTANNVLFEIGAARALKKPIFAVIPDSENNEHRRELPSDLMGMFILDAEKKSVETVAGTLANTLLAA